MSAALDLALVYPGTGRPVRVVGTPDAPQWVAKDVCEALSIGNVSDALSRLEEDEKGSIVSTDGTPGNPRMLTVTQAGLYSLILTSRKQEAKAFKRWAGRCLRSIRAAHAPRPGAIDGPGKGRGARGAGPVLRGPGASGGIDCPL